jgi:hypothetical protein
LRVWFDIVINAEGELVGNLLENSLKLLNRLDIGLAGIFNSQKKLGSELLKSKIAVDQMTGREGYGLNFIWTLWIENPTEESRGSSMM